MAHSLNSFVGKISFLIIPERINKELSKECVCGRRIYFVSKPSTKLKGRTVRACKLIAMF